MKSSSSGHHLLWTWPTPHPPIRQRREFCNGTLFSLINEKWPSTKIVHAKPRHPESKGSVERANREIKNALGSKMRDNSNDLCWVKYLNIVQYQNNTCRWLHVRPVWCAQNMSSLWCNGCKSSSRTGSNGGIVEEMVWRVWQDRIQLVNWRREIYIDIWLRTLIGNMGGRWQTVLLFSKSIDIVYNAFQFLLCVYILSYFVWYTKIRETWRRFMIV